jgi:hypothetical protein
MVGVTVWARLGVTVSVALGVVGLASGTAVDI